MEPKLFYFSSSFLWAQLVKSKHNWQKVVSLARNLNIAKLILWILGLFFMKWKSFDFSRCSFIPKYSFLEKDFSSESFRRVKLPGTKYLLCHPEHFYLKFLAVNTPKFHKEFVSWTRLQMEHKIQNRRV